MGQEKQAAMEGNRRHQWDARTRCSRPPWRSRETAGAVPAGAARSRRNVRDPRAREDASGQGRRPACAAAERIASRVPASWGTRLMSSTGSSADWKIVEAIGDHKAGFWSGYGNPFSISCIPGDVQTVEMAAAGNGWRTFGRCRGRTGPLGSASPPSEPGWRVSRIPLSSLLSRCGRHLFYSLATTSKSTAMRVPLPWCSGCHACRPIALLAAGCPPDRNDSPEPLLCQGPRPNLNWLDAFSTRSFKSGLNSTACCRSCFASVVLPIWAWASPRLK